MRNSYRIVFVIVFVAAVLLLFPACNRSTLRDNQETKYTLGQEFMAELVEDILPYRERPDELSRFDVLVVTDRKTANREMVQQFYDQYKSGTECQLTIAFYTETQIEYIRFIFVNKYEGYYFRYVLDESNTEIEVTAKPINGLEIEVIEGQEELDKTKLAIKQDKKTIASFTFYDL